MQNQEFEKWLVSAGLYQPRKVSYEAAAQIAERLSTWSLKLDCYCPLCGRSSVFTYQPREKLAPGIPLSLQALSRGPSDFERVSSYISSTLSQPIFTCARSVFHTLRIFLSVRVDRGEELIAIEKIGQSPSHFDLISEELQRYSKVLQSLDSRELQSAEICSTHGYHIAAFTYLRRVFERRLEVARSKAKNDADWDDEAYDKTYFMEQKIDLLRQHLPRFLVDERKLYNILSTGVHELTEEQCAQAYTVARLGIMLILDEEIETQERAAKIASARPSLQKLQESHKRPK